MIYAVEIEARLYHVYIVEMDGATPRVGKRMREPVSSEVEARWRASGLLKILETR